MFILGKPDAKKTPLSRNFKHINPTVVSAYTLCRRAESVILMDPESPSHIDSTRAPLDAQLVHIRLLGHLMDKGPGDAATSHIARSVVSAADHEQLLELGKMYLDHFVCTFRKVEVLTPDSSWEPSPIRDTRPSFNTVQEMINAQLIPHPRNHREAQLSALARDNFRCVASGFINRYAVKHNRELFHEGFGNPLWYAGSTECCHIISESTNLHDPKKREHHAGKAWAILKSFGYTQLSTDLAGNKIHSLKNCLTLAIEFCTMFEKFRLWFEATGEPNRYQVCTTQPHMFVFNNYPRFVTFKSTTPELELPSPEFLGLHAACCRVAQMSGAAEYLEILDDPDDDGDRSVVPEKIARALASYATGAKG